MSSAEESQSLVSIQELERSQRRVLASVIADDPYIEHVVSHLHKKTNLEHPVKNWNHVMFLHIQEKYEVGATIAKLAIKACKNKISEAEVPRG